MLGLYRYATMRARIGWPKAMRNAVRSPNGTERVSISRPNFSQKETRIGIYAVYAFARIPDEIVDDPNNRDREEAITKLNSWRDEWRGAMLAGRADDDVMNAIVHAFRKYAIPIEDGEAFLRSMFMDEEKSEYRNYAELEDYMYGSAGVIGLMVTRVVGFSTEDAFPFAIKLGYAFQLTNFLRDIREDCDELGRIYMPQDELERFGLSGDDIRGHVRDERFLEFMKWQIERNRAIYREALPGIKLLNWRRPARGACIFCFVQGDP